MMIIISPTENPINSHKLDVKWIRRAGFVFTCICDFIIGRMSCYSDIIFIKFKCTCAVYSHYTYFNRELVTRWIKQQTIGTLWCPFHHFKRQGSIKYKINNRCRIFHWPAKLPFFSSQKVVSSDLQGDK